MRIEKREYGVTLVPESDFEREILKELRRHQIKKMEFEDTWESKGKFLIDYDISWDR